MPGPAPKEGRRRRNVPARGDWFDLPVLEERVLPELPLLEGDEGWSPATLAMWTAWSEDPATSQWSPAEIWLAIDTARLHNVGLASAMSEVRRRMDTLGLTSKGRQERRWRLPRPEGERAVKGAGELVQPRRLRAVG